MKICMISYSQYEFDNRVHRYAQSLIRRGDNVDVLCLGAKNQAKSEMIQGVRLFRLQIRKYNESGPLVYLLNLLRFFFLSTYHCSLLYIKNRYEVFHFHNIPDFGVFCTVVGRLCGARIVHDIHDLVPEFYQRKFNIGTSHPIFKILCLIEKMACRYAHYVITVTDIWKKTIDHRSMSGKKCTVILNAPDSDLFKPDYAYHKAPPGNKLIYHGNLSEIFGVDLIIKAMPEICREIKTAQLSIYGQGREKNKLINLTKKLNISDKVIFYQPVGRTEVPDILKNADIGIDPKRNGILADEGLSSKCLEYLAMGLPVVVSKTKAASCYYHDKMVLFFEPGNAPDLAKKIIYLCRNMSVRKNMVRQAMQFNQKYHWQKYETIYFAILDNESNQ